MNNRTLVGAGMAGVGTIMFWQQLTTMLINPRSVDWPVFLGSASLVGFGFGILAVGRLGEFE